MARGLLLGAGLLTQWVVPAFGSAALVIHESLSTLPSGWTLSGVPDVDTPIQLSVALSLQNIDQLEDMLHSVSTPGGPKYGQYLDADDIDARFGPSSASTQAVTNWLKGEGITEIYNAGQSISFATTVSKVRKLMRDTS